MQICRQIFFALILAQACFAGQNVPLDFGSTRKLIDPFSGNAYGQGSNFVWMPTSGRFGLAGGFGTTAVGLWTSLDGTNWNKANTRDIYLPNAYTNGTLGPYNTRWSLFFTNGQCWGAMPHDPLGKGGYAQGIDLWRSTDLTNWTRETVLYPLGQATAAGQIMTANWTTDTNGAAWLIFSYATNLVTGTNFVYSMQSSDSTMTNWGAANLIKASDVSQDGVVVFGNSVYYLFYRCKWGGLEYLRATNNNLTSLFVLAPDAAGAQFRGTNWGWGAFANSGNAGQLSILNYSGTKWRAYLNDESSATSTTMSYLDSTDNMTTWSANWTTLSSLTNYFGSGVAMMPGFLNNPLFSISPTNVGNVSINAPIIKAQTINANDGSFQNGLNALDLFTINSISANGAISTRSTLTGDSLNITGVSGGSNTVTITAGNFTVDSAGNVLALTVGAAGITSQSANYVVPTGIQVVELTGNHSATLPSASSSLGRYITVICSSAGTNAILSAAGTFLLHGATAATSATNTSVGNSSTFVSDGTSWLSVKLDN